MRRTTIVLLLALVLLPVAPAVAAPPVCAPGPAELVGGGPTVLVAGQEHVQGYVLRRRLGGGASCVVPGTTVELVARVTGSTVPAVVRTAATDSEGRVHFRVRPPHTVVLMARTRGGDGRQATESVRTTHDVSTRVSLSRRDVAGCREAVAGRTYPAKPGSAVHVRRDPQSADGAEVGRFPVRPDGTWSGTVAVPCSRRPVLLAWIPQTARNGPGDSTRPGPLAARTTTCGTARAPEGEAGGALAHAFEPFNTTTAPYGRWWGERVVTNRTDRSLAFEAYTTDSYQLLRRGTGVLVGGSGFNDAVGVSRHTLAPGEELREVVSMAAANCFAPVPPGHVALGSSPGPALPAGTAVAGQSLLRTDKGWSVSGRVPLTVS